MCSKRSCLQALVAQLASDSEELHQVVSSILRNLSWRADISSKRVLRDIGCVSALMTCALQATKVPFHLVGTPNSAQDSAVNTKNYLILQKTCG